MARRLDLLAHLKAAINSLAPPLSDVVVAVSGGPDSVALLRGLVALVPGRVVAANLNHGLRSDEEGRADQDFVCELAMRLGIKAHTRQVNRAEYPAGNVEAAARKLRYKWLSEVAQEEGIDRVATGHTADDQAETVLMRLFRGSGLGGLTGIAPRRQIAPGIEVVRPLIAATRSDVLAYLESLHQDYRIDATNGETRLVRNRIRHELLPQLTRDYNARVSTHLSQLADEAREWSSERFAFIESALATCERPRSGRMCIFDKCVLETMQQGTLRSMWRRVWQREGWPRDGMGFREYDAVANLCRGRATALDLPGRIRLRAITGVVQAGPIDECEECQ